MVRELILKNKQKEKQNSSIYQKQMFPSFFFSFCFFYLSINDVFLHLANARFVMKSRFFSDNFLTFFFVDEKVNMSFAECTKNRIFGKF